MTNARVGNGSSPPDAKTTAPNTIEPDTVRLVFPEERTTAEPEEAQGDRGHEPLRKMPASRPFFPTLLGTLVFFVSLAAIVTVALYVVDVPPPGMTVETSRWDAWKHIVAPLAGAFAGVVAAGLFARQNRGYSQPHRTDPRVYGELRERLESLDAHLPVLCPPEGPAPCDHLPHLSRVAACNEAWARRDFINSELGSSGSRWVLGSGYVDLWRQLHAAEEALYATQPFADVVGNGLYDELRLEGAAKLPNRQMLQARLQRGLAIVGAPAALAPNPSDADDPPVLFRDGLNAQQGALGRIVFRDVRRAINEFRDGERANLVRARNQLAWTGSITAVAGYVLLTLAVASQAPREAIVGGVAYYLVGATVGLFNQLRSDSDLGVGEEDFGFARARLFYTPVLSGLAAVGGVLILALLGESVNFSALDAANGSGEAQPLSSVFNLDTFAVGLLIAAVFGLTPDLLIDRLKSKTDEYRTALATSNAANGSAAAMGPLQQLRGSGLFVPQVDTFGPR